MIDTLGKIGASDKVALLLEELQLLALPQTRPPNSNKLISDNLLSKVTEALPRFTPVADLEATPLLLSDHVMINGYWNLKTLAPRQEDPDYFALLDRQRATFFRITGDERTLNAPQITDPSLFNHFELDSATPGKFICYMAQNTPRSQKEIAGTRREGLYKLTHYALRIQLAPTGQPAPSELVTEKTALPEGHTLLEFVGRIHPLQRE